MMDVIYEVLKVLGVVFMVGAIIMLLLVFQKNRPYKLHALEDSKGRSILVDSDYKVFVRMLSDTELEVERHNYDCPPQKITLKEGDEDILVSLKWNK